MAFPQGTKVEGFDRDNIEISDDEEYEETNFDKLFQTFVFLEDSRVLARSAEKVEYQDSKMSDVSDLATAGDLNTNNFDDLLLIRPEYKTDQPGKKESSSSYINFSLSHLPSSKVGGKKKTSDSDTCQRIKIIHQNGRVKIIINRKEHFYTALNENLKKIKYAERPSFKRSQLRNRAGKVARIIGFDMDNLHKDWMDHFIDRFSLLDFRFLKLRPAHS